MGSPAGRRLGVLATIALLTGSPALGGGFVEEVVSFGTRDGLTLEGILSYPRKGDGPFPALLIIGGSGLIDADGTLDEPILQITDGRQKVYRNLARGLSRKGYTVLRYNKRGASFDHLNDTPSILAASTVGDLVEDAHAALDALLAHPEAAARPVVVYGHSEGSYVATRLARESGRVDLLVLVGSVASDFEKIFRYQLVRRNMDFLELAADADQDGSVTLEELDLLDGNFGLGSLYVLNTAEVLFVIDQNPDGTLTVHGLNPQTDVNGDGRLDLAGEVRPALRREASRILDLLKAGAEGAYTQSYFSLAPNLRQIHKTGAAIQFVQGETDNQAPVSETLALIDKLERRGDTDYDLLLLPGVGHTLAPPNDFFRGDGGLTILDNQTLNAMSRKTVRRIRRRIASFLREIDSGGSRRGAN